MSNYRKSIIVGLVLIFVGVIAMNAILWNVHGVLKIILLMGAGLVWGYLCAQFSDWLYRRLEK